MTTFSFRGLLTASAAVAALCVSAAYAADAPPKLSAGVAKQIVAAQKAAQGNDWAGAKTALDAASLVPNHTPYDDYEIQEFTLLIDANTNDIPGAAAAAQAAADSPAAPAADQQKNFKNATQLSLMSKQYDKAAVYAKKLQATNPADPSMVEAMGQAYFFAKDYPSAIAVTQKLVDSQLAAKQKPSRNALEVLLNAQVTAKDEEGAEKTLEILVANYNDPNPPSFRFIARIIAARIRLKGFLILDYQSRMDEFYREMGQWVASGAVKSSQTVVEGLENMPEAFLGLFEGANTGKMLVKL